MEGRVLSIVGLLKEQNGLLLNLSLVKNIQIVRTPPVSTQMRLSGDWEIILTQGPLELFIVLLIDPQPSLSPSNF
jgi:hypothetical protein